MTRYPNNKNEFSEIAPHLGRICDERVRNRAVSVNAAIIDATQQQRKIGAVAQRRIERIERREQLRETFDMEMTNFVKRDAIDSTSHLRQNYCANGRATMQMCQASSLSREDACACVHRPDLAATCRRRCT